MPPNYNEKGGPALDLWKAEIAKAMQQGMTRSKAVSHVVKHYPRLQMEVIYESNPDRRREQKLSAVASAIDDSGRRPPNPYKYQGSYYSPEDVVR